MKLIGEPEDHVGARLALAGLIETGGVDALASRLSQDFVHHRPDSTTSTKVEWLAAVGAALGPTAGMQVDILHLLADGDNVDVLRIDNGLIAEAWEIIEPVAHAAANLTWWESGSTDPV